MLDTIFLQIFDMTKVASIVILVVLLVRLCLKRVPKVFSYALWAVVLFRLLCPVSIEAPISLIPLTEPTIESYDLLNEPITPIAAMDAAQQAVGDVLNGGIGIQHVRTTSVDADGTVRVISTDWWNVWMVFLEYVWLAGIAVMLIYSGVTYIKLRRKLLASINVRDNICIADHIDSPFVMGLFRPKIYLPSSLTEKERDYIILHEQHHIHRKDHIVKLLSFAALCLHWFNPLVWAAFILSGKDMEMSCDEAVLRKLGDNIRADYTASLISLATGRRIIAGTLPAFGEGTTEERIKNIAKWKKPAVWVSVVAVIVCVVAVVCLITNPMNRDTGLWGAEYRIDEILYRISDEYEHVDTDSPSICITADYCFYARGTDGEWNFVGKMEPYTLDKEELAEYTAYDDGWLRHYNPGEITDSYIMRMNVTEYEAQLYLAFRTKSGDTLLGIGVEDLSERGQGASDDTAMHFLLRLESTLGGTHLSGEFHERSLAQTVGGDVEIFHTWTNANKPGYMIVGFMSDDSPYMDGFQMPSPEKTDMGFAVFYHNKDESGYRLIRCHVYEDAALAENGIYLCPDQAVLNLSGEPVPGQTYDVILVNNDAVARAERIWEYADGTEKKQSDSYLNGQQMLLYSWEYDKAGCRVWQYFYDEHDELIDYSSIVKNETALNVRKWVDYFRTPEKMDWDIVNQTTLPDYPGVTFTYTSGQIYATVDFEGDQPDEGHTILISGMPIRNAYFSDLNGDGLAEICATVNYGSGIVDTHVVVFDYKTGKEYTLWERGVNDYALRQLNGQLVCDKWAYPDGEVKEYGYLMIQDGKLQWISGIADMVPTTANITGAFDGYLYVPLDGANYRYELIFDDPASVTKGNLIHQFTEEADPQDVQWRVYAVNDYPDRSVVLAEAGEDYVHLYRYSPSKAVDPAMLEQAKEDGRIVLEDGYATSGQAVWNTFCKLAEQGKHISADIVHYHTLRDPGQYDEKYYEAHKEDYPALYEFELTHDSGIYTMKWNEYGTEYVRTYKYLRVFEDTLPTTQSSKEPVMVTRYVLTNDGTATLEDLRRGVASSQLGDYIDFYTIYSDKE